METVLLITEAQLLESFQFIQALALGLIKLSALTFYRRIFTGKGRTTTFDVINNVTIVIVVLWTMVMFIMNALQCGRHMTALWVGPEDWLAYCSTISPKFEEAFGISNVILDVWILALPLPKVFYSCFDST